MTDGDWLKVEVWDQGPGLPAGQEQAVFEKFTRGHAESAAPGVGVGLGLGLAICQAIIQAHRGRIQAANRASGGAVFIFTLPLETPPPLEANGDVGEEW